MINLDPKDIHERLVRAGDKWAKAKFEADQLDDATKPLLSQLGHDSGEESAAARSEAAYRHPDYKIHCKEKNEAKYYENKAKIDYNAAQVWVDVQRTIAATERAINRTAT